MLARSEISTFLHYGFFPVPDPAYRRLPWAGFGREHVSEEDVPLEVRMERGRAALAAAVEDLWTPGDHVLPLSGGVDSRLLLGLLVEAGAGPSLRTVTFGIPGTYDFEIAPLVARRAGVRHEAVDLSRVELDPEELRATLHRAPWTHLFEAVYNHLLPRRFGREATYWSGYMANSMSGIDVEVPSRTWGEACGQFAASARILRRITLTPPGYDPVADLPPTPLLEDSCLTYYEQLFLFLRHARRNESTLLPAGHDYRVPFRHPAWMGFALALPRRWRLRQGLYYRLARRGYPELFDLPTKNNLGLPLGASSLRVLARRGFLKAERTLRRNWPALGLRSDPKLNYDDYDRRLRAPGWMRTTVHAAVASLAERGLLDWTDPTALWREHEERRANHGDALTLLTTLEWNLRELEAGRIPAPPRAGAATEEPVLP